MAELATNFAGFRSVSRPVHDNTGLTGRFDFQIEFAPAFVEAGNPDSAAIANPMPDSGASLFTVIREQLGVKLQGTRGLMDFLVIDHAEHPKEN